MQMCQIFIQRREIIFALYYVTHYRVNVFLFPFVFGFREGTISAGSGITVLLCGLKYFTCLSSEGVTLYSPCK